MLPLQVACQPHTVPAPSAEQGGRVHTQNLFADLNSCMELAASARETASSCLSLIGEDLKFQVRGF